MSGAGTAPRGDEAGGSLAERASCRACADERGASLVEYVLLVAFIAAACVASVTAFGGGTAASLDRTASRIGSAIGTGAGPATPPSSAPTGAVPVTTPPAGGRQPDPGGGNPSPGGGQPGAGNPNPGGAAGGKPDTP